MRPRLAVTVGDPRGIGPEIVVAASRDERVRAVCDLTVVGPTGTAAEPDESIGRWPPAGDIALAGALGARAVERAVAMAMAGEVDGVVTAPIDKRALLEGGVADPGHTEMLARLTAATSP